MKAILTNLLTQEKIEVKSSTDHPASSYGMAVWVDKDGQAYGQCNLPMLGYDVEIIDECDV